MARALSDVKVLIIEDDEPLLGKLCAMLEDEVRELRATTTSQEARSFLESWSPDLLVLDVKLPDGDAFDVLEASGRRGAMPAVVVISGAATPDQSFRLARLGVNTYLSKPFGLDELLEAMTAALREPVNLEPFLRDSVGKRPLRGVETEVRQVMLDEALHRAGGVRNAAARILCISRQLLRHMIISSRG